MNLKRFQAVSCALLVFAGVSLAAVRPAAAQSLDVFAGLNALTANQAAQNLPQLGGGLFPSAGVTLFFGAVGINAEVAGRAGQQSFGAGSLRPAYYDVNFVLVPFHITRSAWPELMLGVGAQHLSAYGGLKNCGSVGTCTDYASTHLSGHVGLLLKFYLTEHIFIQPEAHFYFIHNNVQYQVPDAQRWGVSLGYSFGGGD